MMEIDKKTFLEKQSIIMEKLKNGWKIQQSSANILTFIVQDLLDYAQIKSGKFRKNIMEFNVITAVEEVMIIQQRKAQDNSIRLHATFINIRQDDGEHMIDCNYQDGDYHYMVNTDQ
jgi:signal transduction histidine kinase